MSPNSGMSKLDRILLLVNLLNHRQSATLETIKAACMIPERTAYRYLNVISEANIPVYFDRKHRAYRLNHQDRGSVDDLTVEESVLIVSGLKMLASRLNDEYKAEIEQLIGKVIVRQCFPIEEILKTFEHELDDLAGPPDCSNLITSILINAAILCDKKVSLVTSDNGSTKKCVEIKSPSLWFKKNWKLAEKRHDSAQETSVAGIKKVSVLG